MITYKRNADNQYNNGVWKMIMPKACGNGRIVIISVHRNKIIGDVCNDQNEYYV